MVLTPARPFVLGCDWFIVGETGNVLADDVNYFKSCGANAVLPKPLDFTVLGNIWLEHGMSGAPALERVSL